MTSWVKCQGGDFWKEDDVVVLDIVKERQSTPRMRTTIYHPQETLPQTTSMHLESTRCTGGKGEQEDG